MPPLFASSLLALVLPRHAAVEPEPDKPAYWTEVKAVIDSIPPRLPFESESFKHLKDKMIPKLPSEPARTYAQDAALRLFLMSMLDAPRDQLGAPAVFSAALATIVGDLALFFHQNQDVAQRALDSIVAALSTWELADKVGLGVQHLRLPFVAHYYGVGDGLLLVGVLANEAFRLDYYKNHLPPDMRRLSVAAFNARCRAVRNNPYLVASLLKRFPPRMTAGRTFEKAIFGDAGHAESGWMALAYCCKNFVKVWSLMRWPRTWEVQCRLVQLAPWHIRAEDLDEILTRKRVTF
jgi:hypothetical protein